MIQDLDPVQTQEWMDALDSVLEFEGAERQAPHPGDREIEHRIRSLIRWNAVAIVLRANKESSELGGHIASFQSAATLYDTGFQHFWHAPSAGHGGDLVFVQGHVSPEFDGQRGGRAIGERLAGCVFTVAAGYSRVRRPPTRSSPTTPARRCTRDTSARSRTASG